MKILDIINGVFRENIIKATKVCIDTNIPDFLFIEEASIRSMLASSIFTHIENTHKNDYSFVISECEVLRKNGDKSSKGRVDIFSKIGDEVFYIEVKGACYGYNSYKRAVDQMVTCGLKEACNQIDSIDITHNAP